ncbi:ChbG/HpnK family deacetylase [Adhaeribacter radiodurans]|uniref:ChbG/HpnK family deacetylase n=1 Tax=Adhaeribacter radiodurans TaxID=2745197 RepID=A0A7L7L8I7_9BACT|nr:ChbG/HpnK family deacetylase [Adhaeribacter radiodurans]QMU29140.1 ChbG/HpnK family deacetylase [Adhaeribacter radiodurans]
MITRFSFLLLALSYLLFIQKADAQKNSKKLPELLIRVDDIGMNHATNMAVQQLAESGIPFSASVMFACPWYQETVDILKKYPNADVGVHLTLTAEWKYYRWGPVTGQTAVPSLVDSLGYFFPTSQGLHKNNYKLNEVEKELTAQIERALRSGIKISYLDPHMGVALSTPELRAITEKLARKYKLGISTLNENTYYGETYTDMWGVPVETKKQEFIRYVNNLNKDKPNLVIIHIAQSSPEMDVLVDMNSNLMNSADGKPKATLHRQTELNMLLSPDFRGLIGKKFNLINYRELIKKNGLENRKAVTN